MNHGTDFTSSDTYPYRIVDNEDYVWFSTFEEQEVSERPKELTKPKR